MKKLLIKRLLKHILNKDISFNDEHLMASISYEEFKKIYKDAYIKIKNDLYFDDFVLYMDFLIKHTYFKKTNTPVFKSISGSIFSDTIFLEYLLPPKYEEYINNNKIIYYLEMGHRISDLIAKGTYIKES